MRIISLKPIKDFVTSNPRGKKTLAEWIKIALKMSPKSFVELKTIFNTVDIVEGFFVFDIGGNKYRLIAAIHFNTQVLYVRHVLTHKEYERGAWKQ